MAAPIVSIDTQHNDMIHDSQFDYYSRKLATCSSDRSIKIFDVNGDNCQLTATIIEHEGPVWQVAWAHPKFGVILASCSYDATVVIHREISPNTWKKVLTHKFHESSVNSISWAPHEFGLILACASADGKVSILEYKDDNWSVSHFQNDTLGTNSVSWAPYSAVNSLQEDGRSARRLVTGSCDNSVRIWRLVDAGWTEESRSSLSSHTDWVRDVSWAPNTGLPYNTIASCSEDRTVLIWKQTDSDKVWVPTVMHQFEAPVWRVSWSVTGNVLAVSSGDHKVTLWKHTVDETWTQISSVEEGTPM